jgi:acetoacetyl-CoA synthetase
MSTQTEPELLWEPTPEFRERTVLTRYMRWLADERDKRFEGYHDLWEWSVTDLEGFWGSLWDFFAVRAHAEPETVLHDRAMPGTKWFPGSRLNYAEHVFLDGPDDKVAILHSSELRDDAQLTYGELRSLVARLAGALRASGVEPGDRVVAYMPNIAETVAAFLACASVGATWSSCSPDFGSRSVVDRFAQIEPKVLLAVDGYGYGGKRFDRMDTLAKLQEELPTVERTVLIPYLDPDADPGRLANTTRWEDFLATGEDAPLEFEAVPFDHPLWVLYSSGTTGLPKAIVHGHGGMLLEHLKKLNLHVDAQEGDRLFWFTTTGWMMWNFLVGGLLTPATIVLYDGSPGHPDMGALWDLAERTQMTCFGTSAAYVAGCMKAGVEPREGRDLSRLRSIGSTGSPLSPDGFRWIYEHVGQDTWLFSTSGGTDLCTAFVGGCPLLPVHLGELQARSLGAKVEAFDPDGEPLIDEVGELVLTEPMPSMPLFLWNDPDGERLRESYFDMYPGIWRHGDWIEITSRGTAIITGRSDSTINRGGIRMGTSEIYAAVLALDEITDALVVDIPREGGDSEMLMFVVLREGAELGEDVVKAIRTRIREDCSPRHVPDSVEAIGAVPRTLSGKVLEVPVKRILSGTPPEKAASRESLANPEALDWFVEYAERR